MSEVLSDAKAASALASASTTRVDGELHFAEVYRSGFQQRFQVREHLWEGRSEYQHVEIIDTVAFGKALVLDDAMQTTEADEFLYHEPLVHIPLLAHPNPRRVLVVGGGDGGALRHVLMHETVEKAVQVEIDELVVTASLKWLPGLSGGAFDHPRAELIIGDGLAYMRDVSEPFDVILVDSTDPVGPAEGLISEEFYRLAAGALSEDGIFAMQTGSPLLMRDELDSAAERMRTVFPLVGTYLGHVPSYPGVLWSWTAGSKTLDPSVPRRTPPAGLRFYTPDVHRGAFALPPYIAATRATPATSEGAAHGAASAAVRGPLLG